MKQSTFALLAVAILIVFLSSLFGCKKAEAGQWEANNPNVKNGVYIIPSMQEKQEKAAANFESSGEYQMYVDNDFITIYDGTRLVKKVPLKDGDPVAEAIIEDNL